MYNSEDGSALVLILVISTLLLASSFWAISTFKEGVRATEQFMDKFQARLGAESALQVLKYYGATGRFASSTIRNDLPEKMNFPAAFSLAGQEVKVSLADTNITISLLDSSAVLNCYYMDEKVLAGLLLQFGLDEDKLYTIVDSYRDWVDKNDLHHVNGAETYFYTQERKAVYEPRNSKSLQSIWEMSLLREMDTSTWERLRPFLTLSPKQGFNIQTMSPAMLAAYFGLDGAQSQQLARVRSREGYLTTSLLEDITGRKYRDIYEGLNNFPSRILRVRIDAVSGDAHERYQGWLKFVPDKQGPYRILSWAEGLDD